MVMTAHFLRRLPWALWDVSAGKRPLSSGLIGRLRFGDVLSFSCVWTSLCVFIRRSFILQPQSKTLIIGVEHARWVGMQNTKAKIDSNMIGADTFKPKMRLQTDHGVQKFPPSGDR